MIPGGQVEKKAGCRFCFPPESERILFEAKTCFVMLSLGPVVPGYLLVISKFHVECCGGLTGDLATEFFTVVQQVQEIQSKVYGTRSILYEHGRTGSCLHENSPYTHCYHAHMHCVPTNLDVGALVAQDFSFAKLGSWADFHETYKARDRSYLFVDSGEKRLFFIERKLRDQYLRRKLASAIGDEDLADWVAFPGWRSIRESRDKLAPHFHELGSTGLNEDERQRFVMR